MFVCCLLLKQLWNDFSRGKLHIFIFLLDVFFIFFHINYQNRISWNCMRGWFSLFIGKSRLINLLLLLLSQMIRNSILVSINWYQVMFSIWGEMNKTLKFLWKCFRSEFYLMFVVIFTVCTFEELRQEIFFAQLKEFRF